MRREPSTCAIEVFKSSARRYRSVLHRADGVDVAMDGGSYNRVGGAAGEVPHDIAHLIVEQELGLERGVWGVLAAGGLFRGAAVIAGRRPPHADRRAREVLDAATEQLNQAEILTRAVCDLSMAGTADLRALQAATGARWWRADITEEALARAIDRLRDTGERWERLAPGDRLAFSWPVARPRRRARRPRRNP